MTSGGKTFYLEGEYFIETHYEKISNTKKKVLRVFVKSAKINNKGENDDAMETPK